LDDDGVAEEEEAPQLVFILVVVEAVVVSPDLNDRDRDHPGAIEYSRLPPP